MSKGTFSLRTTLLSVLLMLAVVPVIIFSTLLIVQFEAIQEREQMQKFSAQADNVTQTVEFDLAFFFTRFTQASRDNVLAIAAHTGTFGERAQMKMNVILQEHPLVGALLLTDDKMETLSAVPTLIELLDTEELKHYVANTLQQKHTDTVGAFMVESPALVQALRAFGVTESLSMKSDYVLIYAAPVIMSDSRISDAFAKTTGLLVAVLPIENIFNALRDRASGMTLDKIAQGSIDIGSETSVDLNRVIQVKTPLVLDGIEEEWDVYFSRNRKEAFSSVNQLTERYILWAAIFVAVLLVTSLAISRVFLYPIGAMNDIIGQYLKRDYRPTYKDLYFSEVQETVDVLANMAQQIQLDHQELEERVRVRTAELSQANSELSNAMEQLTITQEKLIEQEKMSLLGQLVAGIAHEINTPLGICVTAGTTLSQTLTTLQTAYNDNKVSRKMFEDFFAEFEDGFTIMLSNLERAATLMQNFKLIAVDSASEVHREFNLYTYIQETLHSLAPELRAYKVTTEVIGDRRVRLDSYPGAYAQIFTNLVLNSLRHGFTKDVEHHIIIEFSLRGTMLHLTYRDDGKGVNQEHLHKLFEPFYTTLSNQGGSGLGLNIVSNIVTMKLKGKVEAESSGRGLSFIFAIPQ